MYALRGTEGQPPAEVLRSPVNKSRSGQERYRRLFRVLAFLCGLSYYPLLYWSLMGMETGLLTVLLSLSVLSALKYGKDCKPTQGVLFSVTLGLAFLTRSDAVVEYSIKKLRPTFVEGFEWSGQSLQSWGESKYANVNYEGQSLYFLRGSTKQLAR